MSAVETKSFDISKREVWEEYKRVKANRGAAGIDAMTIDIFDQDLSKNLLSLPVQNSPLLPIENSPLSGFQARLPNLPIQHRLPMIHPDSNNSRQTGDALFWEYFHDSSTKGRRPVYL